MGIAGGTPPPEMSRNGHRRLDLVCGRITFANGYTARIVFRPSEIVVGCHTVSLEAWREMHRRYEEYLSGKQEQVFQP